MMGTPLTKLEEILGNLQQRGRQRQRDRQQKTLGLMSKKKNRLHVRFTFWYI